jgi:hypothetical protein
MSKRYYPKDSPALVSEMMDVMTDSGEDPELKRLVREQYNDDRTDTVIIAEDTPDKASDVRSTWQEEPVMVGRRCVFLPNRPSMLTPEQQEDFWRDFDKHGNIRRKSDWTGLPFS